MPGCSSSTIFRRRRRRTVNIISVRFQDGADSTVVTVTSSLSTSNECQSLLDRTNSVGANDICLLCQYSNNHKSGRLCSICGLFYHLTCVRLGKAESNALRSWICQRCLSPVSVTTSEPAEHQAATQPSAGAQLLTLSEKRKTATIPLKIPKGAQITAAAALADIIDCALVDDDQSWERLTRFVTAALWWWWWCRPHPVREHAQDLRPPLGARPASPPNVKQRSHPHGVRPQIPDR